MPDPTAFEEPLLSSTITVVYLVGEKVGEKAKVMFLEQTGLGGLVTGVSTAGVLCGAAGGGGVIQAGRERAVRELREALAV